MKTRAIVTLAAVLMISLMPMASQALTPYSQDFEGLGLTDPAALSGDGWLVYATVFGPDWSYWYGYGAYPAPNDGFAFCQLVAGEGGGTQGLQQLVIFSDYNNGDHANGAFIEANTFEEQTVGAGDVGETWEFTFDAKMGNLEGTSTALAYIKTLNPAAGWATTNYITADMTNTSASWTTNSLTIVIDASLVGQILQFGFSNTATLYQGAGVYYDNVTFGITGPVAIEEASWGSVKSLFR